MVDRYQREIDYLRVSITDRCNLRCRYCMPEDLPSIPHEQILRYEEIERICRLAVQAGIRHVRVTGGEPLVRKGCLNFLECLKKMPGMETVAVTTNAVLLEEAVPRLFAMGIDGVNISLDSLKKDTFLQITNRDEFESVFRGFQAAVKAELSVKINCVPQKGVNDGELIEIACLAKDYPVDVRFIEMMPVGYGMQVPSVGSEEVKAQLTAAFPGIHSCEEKRGFGPAHYYEIPGFQGRIGIIEAMSHCFCSECNRIRLTSEGFLKLCLCYDQGIDLRTLLRTGATDAKILSAIEKGIFEKPRQHVFDSGKREETRTMSQIGG